MKRFFGAKSQQPTVTLEEATQKLDARSDTLEQKIKKLEAELVGYREQLKKTRPGTALHNNLRQKALRVMKQKKMYENQRDQMMNQSFNMEQANFAKQTMQDTITTVAAMKDANKAMKTQFKKINIDDIENLQDDMTDLLDQNNEIQDVLGRSYDVGEVDESELDEELEALGEEMAMEGMASYLQSSAVPTNDPMSESQQEPVALTH